MTLTANTYTEWIDGSIEKEDIDELRFKEIAKAKFGI
jgi:N-hydroxyarylamine O-acetyltransferase